MTTDQRVKFLSLCKAVVDTMAATDEPLRDLFDAMLTTPFADWPKGAGVRMTTITGSTINALFDPPKPVIVSAQDDGFQQYDLQQCAEFRVMQNPQHERWVGNESLGDK